MKTSHGSCFCGAVAFEAEGDLGHGTMGCNGLFCRKMRYREMRLPDAYGLRGLEALAETPRIQDDGVDMHHVLCRRCGTRLWTRENIAERGGRFTMICVPALDDVPDEERIAAPIHHADGAHDDWGHRARETRHP